MKKKIILETTQTSGKLRDVVIMVRMREQKAYLLLNVIEMDNSCKKGPTFWTLNSFKTKTQKIDPMSLLNSLSCVIKKIVQIKAIAYIYIYIVSGTIFSVFKALYASHPWYVFGLSMITKAWNKRNNNFNNKWMSKTCW